MKKDFIVPVLLLLLIASCNQKLSNQSIDFTKEHEFTKGIEGPATNEEGIIYAVNFKEEGTIGKVDKNGKASLFLKLNNGSIGNGIRFDKAGNMFIADYVNHGILKVEKGEKKYTMYAKDSTMNQPNDLAISPKGILYASDPNWAKSTGKLWMAKEGQLFLLEKDMGTTNGIEVSPDGKNLYVNESVQRKIWKYDILSDGALANKIQFASFSNFGLDGMRCDANGNLYVCRYDKGTVVVFSPEGNRIREIQLKGKKPTNITFGGRDNKQCFVTLADRGCFETFYAANPGRSFQKD